MHMDIWDIFLLTTLKFRRLVYKGICRFNQIRVQNYCFYSIYANFALFFYIVGLTIVVVSVDVNGEVSGLLGFHCLSHFNHLFFNLH